MNPRDIFKYLIEDAFDRGLSKRQLHIRAKGVDPKTGLTHRQLHLTDQTRTRGGKNSRRRTTRVWQPTK